MKKTNISLLYVPENNIFSYLQFNIPETTYFTSKAIMYM